MLQLKDKKVFYKYVLDLIQNTCKIGTQKRSVQYTKRQTHTVLLNKSYSSRIHTLQCPFGKFIGKKLFNFY